MEGRAALPGRRCMPAKQAAEELDGNLVLGHPRRSGGLREGALRVSSVPEEAGKFMKMQGRVFR